MSDATLHSLRQRAIGAGFAVLKATRLHRGLGGLTRGQGAILTFHQVRPRRRQDFAPNQLLEVTPAFLDAALLRIRALGFDIVSLDEATRRLDRPGARPFVVLTFDDGYTDNLTYALPLLERHNAPFTLYVVPGFADRTARMWWIELEAAVRRLSQIEVEVGATRLQLASRSPAEKANAFQTLYWMLRGAPEPWLLDVCARLLGAAGIEARALVEKLCLDWEGLRHFARHPLCTIGAHSMTHAMLAKLEAEAARFELAESRRVLEMRFGLPVRHVSYPVGDASAAGPRDFALALELGFTTAVTTRPGMIFSAHRDHLTALPRISVNGLWQSLDSLDVLLSGVPFVFWNRGRKIVA